MSRKYDYLDVVKMMATLTMEHWRHCLELATKRGDINKLIQWRYGLQAGLVQAVNQRLSTEKMDLWVMKRCKDLERCMRVILKNKHKNPHDNPKLDPLGYVRKAKEAKKKRDREFEDFLMRSSF